MAVPSGGAPSARAADPAEGPIAVVRTFQSHMIAVMKEAQTLGFQGRFERLRPAVQDAFALRSMARIAVGDFWDRAPADDRQRLIEAFERMSVSTLATLLDGYSGQEFEVIGTRDGPQDTRIVDTRLRDPDGDSHDISYVSRQNDGRWRLVDVIVDGGISELSVRRSEYHRTLSQGGVAALVGVLRAKADELAKP